MFDAIEYMSAFGYLEQGEILMWLHPAEGNRSRSLTVLVDDVAGIEGCSGFELAKETYDCRIDLLPPIERLEAARKHSGRKAKAVRRRVP
jgi:hypothetical protein